MVPGYATRLVRGLGSTSTCARPATTGSSIRCVPGGLRWRSVCWPRRTALGRVAPSDRRSQSRALDWGGVAAAGLDGRRACGSAQKRSVAAGARGALAARDHALAQSHSGACAFGSLAGGQPKPAPMDASQASGKLGTNLPWIMTGYRCPYGLRGSFPLTAWRKCTRS